MDQTGFLKGRCISENLIYATELIQACHARKCQTLIIKLDFAKAFDSVNWQSLFQILSVRGFPDNWISWIKNLLQTSKSAVLLNGILGKWITCKKGLRQGDPLSPYLFILVADVLQRLLERNLQIRHPIYHDRPCATIQYADDTLVICRAVEDDVLALKSALLQFSKATGLQINFAKSTMISLHIDQSKESSLSELLQCKLESLPMAYLGLPLSLHKLTSTDLQPIVSKVDRFLAGWEAALLSQAERLILVNAVLSIVPVYAMSAFKLPPKVIEAIDKRRRAFFWTGEDVCSGAKCLVAWDEVCAPKEKGGLGIKCLKSQNEALLLKRLFNLFSNESTWANWIWKEFHGKSIMKTLPLGQHWSVFQKLLPELYSLTSVHIGDGTRTSFWHDRWTGSMELASKFESLFSHSTDVLATVQQILSIGISNFVTSRLTVAAMTELQELHTILQSFTLTNESDTRLNVSHDILTTKKIYESRFSTGTSSPNWKFIWECRAPLKINIFAWLLVRNRLSTKKNLMKKKIVQTVICEICNLADETADHLSFTCPFAISFWQTIRVQPIITETKFLFQLEAPAIIPTRHFQSFFLLCLWTLWNHRHDVVFRERPPSIAACLQRGLSESTLWAAMFTPDDRTVIDIWKGVFSSRLQTLNSL